MSLSESQRRYLYFTVFTSGMTTLAIELAASRLLGNIFGTSNLVWACIIGLILIYLTAGYFIGGKWADRYPHPRTMYVILVWGAFLSGLIPLPAGPILHRRLFQTLRRMFRRTVFFPPGRIGNQE